MTSRIEWVASQCRLLATIAEEFDRTQTFKGLTIGTGIHIEPKTVAMLLTLHRGGARLISTGNLNTTQPASVAYLNAHDVEAIGEPTQARCLEAVAKGEVGRESCVVPVPRRIDEWIAATYVELSRARTAAAVAS